MGNGTGMTWYPNGCEGRGKSKGVFQILACLRTTWIRTTLKTGNQEGTQLKRRC